MTEGGGRGGGEGTVQKLTLVPREMPSTLAKNLEAEHNTIL